MFDKNFRDRKFDPMKGLMFVVMIALFFAAMSAVVMLLWNWILPEVAGMKPLKFWQAAGLLVLFKILFGGFGKGRGGWKKRMERRKHWKEKWMNMSEEERSEFKSKWKDRCRKRGED